ncbi:hypothetical protein GIB67_039944 [Kingdonia uniflora]|uniref:Uncharacterized protein n=1 Tax=Kingdonia uniflora TaxID=39325 RepID=A0A7J7P3U9_9MAGN|nr:hypothetical protein GIB67_039944 [Kingdonia uniflora]
MVFDTKLDDIPDAILSNIFSLVSDARSRNSMTLVSRKWLLIERTTRTALTLRGNVRDLFMIPSCFKSVRSLDLSLLSPWGDSLLDSSPDPLLLSHFLAQSFPVLESLTVYARTPSTLEFLVPHWRDLKEVKLVRWHQRCPSPLGSDFVALFQHCVGLSKIDLSSFYCWTEDLPPVFQAYPLVSSSITSLNLLISPSSEGFKSHEVLAISAACPNLKELWAKCMFDPSFIDFVGDEAISGLVSNCPKLCHLHLVKNKGGDVDEEGLTVEDARISRSSLENMFLGLPLLEELVLDVGFNVLSVGSALEMLNSKCSQLKSVKLGQFHGICKAVGSMLDGVAVCRGLEALSVKNSADLSDSSLMQISVGCPKLSKFVLEGCNNITEMGVKNFMLMLKFTLVDVKVSRCRYLNASSTLRALDPIRGRIKRLHLECIWKTELELDEVADRGFDLNELNFDLNNECQEAREFRNISATKRSANNCCDFMDKKKCKYSNEINGNVYHREKTWDRLKYLSLWIPVGQVLSPLHSAGLESCPVLEEIKIRVEGDCRTRTRPMERAFGLSSFTRYPQLKKMQLNCGDAIGYALTAPSGQMDLSLWERFYLSGIRNLNLSELDYWPPQDRDVNQRSLSLPAAGLLQECVTLRKLFIHGTANEHFMKFFLNIPNLRDVQLREDYYPAPEDDMSTEMRVESCRRFEEALNSREIID